MKHRALFGYGLGLNVRQSPSYQACEAVSAYSSHVFTLLQMVPSGGHTARVIGSGFWDHAHGWSRSNAAYRLFCIPPNPDFELASGVPMVGPCPTSRSATLFIVREGADAVWTPLYDWILRPRRRNRTQTPGASSSLLADEQHHGSKTAPMIYVTVYLYRSAVSPMQMIHSKRGLFLCVIFFFGDLEFPRGALVRARLVMMFVFCL